MVRAFLGQLSASGIAGRPRAVLLAAASSLAMAFGAAQSAQAAGWPPFFDAPPSAPMVDIPHEPGHHFQSRRVRKPEARQRTRMREARDEATPARKPEGPVTIAISLNRQHLTIYDANGVFAESRISSGKAGHSTPRGVFSIIQKRKWHRSNIYAGAPMPYMQRITWSGVALHAGIVPGYPASHGCVRLPDAFASQLWRWTRIGARVVIGHDEIKPADIAHPQLLARLPEPIAPVADKPAVPAPAVSPPMSDKPSEPEKKADALHGLRLTLDESSRPTLSDASALDLARPAATETKSVDVAAKDAPPKEGDRDEFDAGRDGPEDAQTAQPGSDAKPADTAQSDKPADKPADTTTAVKAEPASPANPPSSDVTASTGLATDTRPAAVPAFIPPPPSASGHVAMFVSRKEKRLYVRRNFQPWFQVPVSIKDDDRDLGTHVFTARLSASDKSALLWSALSMSEPKDPPRRESARKGKGADIATKAAESVAQPAPTATDALDRITLPAEAMAQVGPLLGDGASMVISDKGLGPETGEGTDFIVLTR